MKKLSDKGYMHRELASSADLQASTWNALRCLFFYTSIFDISEEAKAVTFAIAKSRVTCARDITVDKKIMKN